MHNTDIYIYWYKVNPTCNLPMTLRSSPARNSADTEFWPEAMMAPAVSLKLASQCIVGNKMEPQERKVLAQ
jgi:hypothetical protein